MKMMVMFEEGQPVAKQQWQGQQRTTYNDHRARCWWTPPVNWQTLTTRTSDKDIDSKNNMFQSQWCSTSQRYWFSHLTQPKTEFSCLKDSVITKVGDIWWLNTSGSWLSSKAFTTQNLKSQPSNKIIRLFAEQSSPHRMMTNKTYFPLMYTYSLRMPKISQSDPTQMDQFCPPQFIQKSHRLNAPRLNVSCIIPQVACAFDSSRMWISTYSLQRQEDGIDSLMAQICSVFSICR